MRWLQRMIFVFAGLIFLTAWASADTFYVTSSEDTGPGTLREVIAASNTNTGVQTIAFAVSNSITLYSGINITDTVVIEGGGTTIGAKGNDIIFGLEPGADGSIVRGLALINASGHYAGAIFLDSNSNKIMSCSIGTDWAGTTGCGNYFGILVMGNNASNNQIGGNASLGEGNVISGNYCGIQIYNQNIGNSICGNIIGLNALKTAAIANYYAGIDIYGSNNFIGLPINGYGNIIAGNEFGIIFDKYGSAQNNIIQNNLIGITDNNTAIGNFYGIYFDLGTGYSNLIGGLAEPLGYQTNIISGNTAEEIYLNGYSSNTIVGNYVGTRIDGTGAVSGGALAKVYIGLSNSNMIGCENTGKGNLLVGGNYGIWNAGGEYNGFYANTICAFTSNLGIRADANTNQNKTVPNIAFANLWNIWGTSVPGDYIEVFKADRNSGGGFNQGGSLKLLGKTTADVGGQWGISSAGMVSLGDFVCATASNAQNNTSPFTVNLAVRNDTPTITPSVTVTRTVTSTPTFTRTKTASPTVTASPTLTPTGTNTVSPTSTATPTVSPTYTTSATVTVSPTLTWSPTVTATPSVSPTNTITPVLTATPTLTLTPTISPTPLISPTPSVTLTLTGTSNILGTLKNKIVVFPNPARNLVHFAWSDAGVEKIRITVFNMAGEQIAVLTANPPGQTLTWNISGIAPGIYIYRATLTENGSEQQLPAQKLAILKP